MWLTDLCRVVSVVAFVMASVMLAANADLSFSQARFRQYNSALKAAQPAVYSYLDLKEIQSALATKQLNHAPITPQEKDERMKAVDLYISDMRSYRAAMRLYKTWLLKHHEISKSSDGWSVLVRAEWKDGQLDFHEPYVPLMDGRTDLELRQLNAHLKTFESKRASCIKQHCQILHRGTCAEIKHGVWEGYDESFDYLTAPFAP
ncbi:MAG: hypothetical protein M1826_007661 [Phylliscum demangeonii]|nr:MAG: hypothetical protein M1826_007661 [Phylliscum demangeonii]